MVLSENQAALLGEVESLARLAGSAPTEVKTADDLDTVGKLVTAAGKLWTRTDGVREREKAPHLAAGREVDAFFRTPLDRLDRIKKVMTDRASIYQRKVADEAREKAAAEAKRLRDEQAAASNAEQAKEVGQAAKVAEATAAAPVKELARTTTSSGITAGAKTSWVFEVTDWTAIPLDKLRPYLDHAAIEKAIKAAVKIGERNLDGVRIFEQSTATFRQ